MPRTRHAPGRALRVAFPGLSPRLRREAVARRRREAVAALPSYTFHGNAGSLGGPGTGRKLKPRRGDDVA